MNEFFYIDKEIKTIENNKYICIYVFEFSKKHIFKIYKPYSDELYSLLDNLKCFDTINSYISFVIKRDGKIALDINI